ncbi:DUF4920 domain-containing protein [Psychroflexus halocasei]|uniref:DUF4920 domain-containing protein n=1 Tax=Psychroflexus halocasei TaxID=908615 RepID=A0A1H4D8Y6_9FLAO|nr:DUF4920 domain-containing protein [Psychroflexus halocasei]SEA68762.1 protein of unknown function [Psychroflexus halocasei]
MKKLFLLLITLGLFACADNKSNGSKSSTPEQTLENDQTMSHDSDHSEEEMKAEKGVSQDDIDPNQTDFGANFKEKDVKSNAEMLALYKDMKVGDTLSIQYEAEINSVCQKKGCWVRLKLDDQDESFIKFKDYAFFLPKDAEGRKAVVQGKAYVKEVSVDDLKHFAEDAGKTEEEIAKISEPELTYAFMADGVKLEPKS